VGAAAAEPAPQGLAPHYLGQDFRSYSDTAEAIAALDLVISVDTSVAHLAGAMGRETWLILPPNPDWRWGMNGETTEWYPSMRLFRRERGEDKAVVFARMAAALDSRHSAART
jgi:ADP-heptose:LPS heptosyltransferase